MYVIKRKVIYVIWKHFGLNGDHTANLIMKMDIKFLRVDSDSFGILKVISI